MIEKLSTLAFKCCYDNSRDKDICETFIKSNWNYVNNKFQTKIDIISQTCRESREKEILRMTQTEKELTKRHSKLKRIQKKKFKVKLINIYWNSKIYSTNNKKGSSSKKVKFDDHIYFEYEEKVNMP
jgi:hypothetical protein